MLAGLDPQTWVQEGWIDYLVVSTFNECDSQIPVHEFARFINGTSCNLLVAMGSLMGGYWSKKPEIKGRDIAQAQSKRPGYAGMLLTAEEARGCAANYYARGAQGIST